MQYDHQSSLASALTTPLTIFDGIHYCLLLWALSELSDNLFYIYFTHLRGLVFFLLLLYNFLGYFATSRLFTHHSSQRPKLGKTAAEQNNKMSGYQQG